MSRSKLTDKVNIIYNQHPAIRDLNTIILGDHNIDSVEGMSRDINKDFSTTTDSYILQDVEHIMYTTDKNCFINVEEGMKTTTVESEFAKMEKHKRGETADVATRDKEKRYSHEIFDFLSKFMTDL